MNKKPTLLALLFVLSFNSIGAQTTIYNQSFDAGTGLMPPALPTGWSSSTTTTQTMDNVPYSGVPGVGDYNLFLANCQSSGQARNVIVSGINTTGWSGLTIAFGHRRTNLFNVTVDLHWSNDGSNWNPISFSTPATDGVWELFQTSDPLPAEANNQPNLRFRWSWTTNTNNGCATASPNYRIDEFTVNADIMPVTLTNFTVRSTGFSTICGFSTASERNNAYFSIERSNDGKTFAEIGQVRGAGNSVEPKNYAFTDERPLKGRNYYRLRQVDFDGSGTYSRVVSALLGKTGNLSLSPTPATNHLRLALDEPLPEGASYEVFDQFGRLLLQGAFASEDKEQEMDVTSLAQGVYVLRLKSGQTMLAKQFLKQ